MSPLLHLLAERHPGWRATFPAEALSALAGGDAEVAVESVSAASGSVASSSGLSGANLETAVRALGRPLLVLHAPTDQLVDVDNARRIFGAARHPTSFVPLDGADDLLTGAGDGAYLADILAPWGEPVPSRSCGGSGDAARRPTAMQRQPVLARACTVQTRGRMWGCD